MADHCFDQTNSGQNNNSLFFLHNDSIARHPTMPSMFVRSKNERIEAKLSNAADHFQCFQPSRNLVRAHCTSVSTDATDISGRPIGMLLLESRRFTLLTILCAAKSRLLTTRCFHAILSTNISFVGHSRPRHPFHEPTRKIHQPRLP